MRKDLVNSCNSLPGLLSSKGYSRQGSFTAADFFTADEARFALLVCINRDARFEALKLWRQVLFGEPLLLRLLHTVASSNMVVDACSDSHSNELRNMRSSLY